MTSVLAMADCGVVLGGRRVISGVSLEVRGGEVVGVLGANGGGKTTLLRAALGLARLTSGQVRLGGCPIGELTEARRAALAAYLPQDRRVGWNLPAWRIVALGLPLISPSRARPNTLAALGSVGAEDLAERGILDMSGGERARVLIARLIVTGAPLLIADEPAAGLDPEAQFQVMEVLRTRAALGAAVLVSLHDLTLAARCCDRVVVLGQGRMLADGPPAATLTPDLLASAFALDGALIPSAMGHVLAARRLR